jgi:hypothetical protein
MVNGVYGPLVDPASWPEEEERKRLAAMFGFDAEEIWALTPDLALERQKSR